MKSKFTFISLIAGVVLAAALGTGYVLATDEAIVMYKDPNCGCCGAWADHMRENGFTVKEINSSDMGAVKQEFGVPRELGSCHTAKVGKYFVEGHVPASDVKRMLAEKPAILGISAPGMPLGSPGMEGPYPAENYDVVSLGADGKVAVFARH